MKYLFRKSTEGERRLIYVAARAGVMTNLCNTPLGERLKAEQARKEDQDRWTPKPKKSGS